MRAIISLAALCVVVYSIATDFSTPVPGSILCRAGLCRFDQIYQGIDATGDRPDALAALVDEDSSNPLVWSSYGEALAREGQEQAAGDAFERAAALGSGMPAIQIRAANFFFTHGNARRAAELSGEPWRGQPLTTASFFPTSGPRARLPRRGSGKQFPRLRVPLARG